MTEIRIYFSRQAERYWGVASGQQIQEEGGPVTWASLDKAFTWLLDHYPSEAIVSIGVGDGPEDIRSTNTQTPTYQMKLDL